MYISSIKTWNREKFWGLSYDLDPQWVLTPAQQKLQAELIDLCATTLRSNAFSSKAEKVAEGWEVLKKASWTTSAGFADWYVVQTTSPDFDGDYSNLSCFLVYEDEVQAEPKKWDALGLRGNQSGTLLVDNVTIPPERMIGKAEEGAIANDEIVDPFFLLCSSACWNGIS